MPRTKKRKATQPAVVVNGTPEDVLTLAEAAAYLRLPESSVLNAVQAQGLPARLIAGEWRFLKSAIQSWLTTSAVRPEMTKAAQRSFIGAWKDDPYLEDMVEEIYRKRGRPITEDGSYRLFHGLSWEKDQK